MVMRSLSLFKLGAGGAVVAALSLMPVLEIANADCSIDWHNASPTCTVAGTSGYFVYGTRASVWSYAKGSWTLNQALACPTGSNVSCTYNWVTPSSSSFNDGGGYFQTNLHTVVGGRLINSAEAGTADLSSYSSGGSAPSCDDVWSVGVEPTGGSCCS
jgi:hypothetical protein